MARSVQLASHPPGHYQYNITSQLYKNLASGLNTPPVKDAQNVVSLGGHSDFSGKETSFNWFAVRSVVLNQCAIQQY